MAGRSVGGAAPKSIWEILGLDKKQAPKQAPQLAKNEPQVEGDLSNPKGGNGSSCPLGGCSTCA